MKSKLIIIVVLSALIATACKKKINDIPAQDFTEYQLQWVPYHEGQNLIFINQSGDDSVQFKIDRIINSETYRDHKTSFYGPSFDRVFRNNKRIDLIINDPLFNNELRNLSFNLNTNQFYNVESDSIDFYLELVTTPKEGKDFSSYKFFRLSKEDDFYNKDINTKYYISDLIDLDLDTIWMKNDVGLYQFTTRFGDKYTIIE